jgi:hypothetical protein
VYWKTASRDSLNPSNFAAPNQSERFFRKNKLLQPITMAAASPTQTVFSLAYDFHLGSGNNGNVWAITNNKDATRNEAFTYDPAEPPHLRPECRHGLHRQSPAEQDGVLGQQLLVRSVGQSDWQVGHQVQRGKSRAHSSCQ